jgi:phage shock protein A
LFERLKKLFGATANKALDQLETPEILAEKALNELESNLKQLTDGVASSMANEKQLDKKLKANSEQLEVWQKRAGVAVQNNNDEVARECLVKKNELLQLDVELKEQLRAQQSTTAELKQRYRETETALKQLRSQKDNIGARSQAADALAKANQILSATGAGGGMAQWEEKINMKEARAQAAGEMAQESKLQDQIQQSSIEDELAALKQSTAPKLIEDKQSES